ncbi:MAG: rod shape-determining protein MreD [Acidimicrobiales bacterium]
MTGRSAARLVLVVALFVVVQETVAIKLLIAGIHPELMLLVPIAAGMAAGPSEGAIAGFLAGIAIDLLLPTPFGLTALVGCLTGVAVGRVTGSLTREIRWFGVLVAFTASAGAVMLYVVLGAVLGQDQFLRVDLVALVLVVAVTNAVLAPLGMRLVRWALGPAADPRAAAGSGW